jgi:hypothetical protein
MDLLPRISHQSPCPDGYISLPFLGSPLHYTAGGRSWFANHHVAQANVVVAFVTRYTSPYPYQQREPRTGSQSFSSYVATAAVRLVPMSGITATTTLYAPSRSKV